MAEERGPGHFCLENSKGRLAVVFAEAYGEPVVSSISCWLNKPHPAIGTTPRVYLEKNGRRGEDVLAQCIRSGAAGAYL